MQAVAGKESEGGTVLMGGKEMSGRGGAGARGCRRAPRQLLLV